MILEVVRIVADWLATSPTGRLSTIVPTVPRDGADPVPTAPTVVDETRNAEAARDHAPTTGLPVLQVTVADSGFRRRAPGIQPAQPDLTVDLSLRLVYQASETQHAIRDSSYVLDAIHRSLDLLMRTSAGEAARVRNQVQLLSFTDQLIGQAAFTPIGDTVVTGGMILSASVRTLKFAPV